MNRITSSTGLVKTICLWCCTSFKTEGALGQFKPPVRVWSEVPVANVFLASLTLILTLE